MYMYMFSYKPFHKEYIYSRDTLIVCKYCVCYTSIVTLRLVGSPLQEEVEGGLSLLQNLG